MNITKVRSEIGNYHGFMHVTLRLLFVLLQPSRALVKPPSSHRPQLAVMRNCNAMPCANVPPCVATCTHKKSCKNVATETSYVEAATPHDDNTDSQPLRPFAYDKELIEKDYLGVFQRVHFIEPEHEKKLEWVTIPPILVPQPVLLNNIFGTNRGKDIFKNLMCVIHRLLSWALKLQAARALLPVSRCHEKGDA